MIDVSGGTVGGRSGGTIELRALLADGRAFSIERLVPPDRIELSISPLPMEEACGGSIVFFRRIAVTTPPSERIDCTGPPLSARGFEIQCNKAKSGAP